MIVKWLFSGTFFFESGSWVVLMNSPSLAQGMIYSVVPHAIACALLALALWLLLPRHYQLPLPWSPLFLFSIAFFIPVLGIIGLVTAVFPGLYSQRRRRDPVWQAMGVPDLPFRPLERRNSPMFHDGGLQDVLHLATDPERRINALLATRRMPEHESVPILKVALRDTSDDVRLLAYSMLDQKESRINQQIEKRLLELAEGGSQSLAVLHAGLARWYWELAYLGLAQGTVLTHVLSRAHHHVKQSLALEADPEVEFIGGRIALEQGELAQARTFFRHAELGGIRFAKIAPYLAETAFLAGDYAEVPRLLVRLPEEALSRPPFLELARYWL